MNIRHFLVSIAPILLLVGCGKHSSPAPTVPPPPAKVRIAVATAESLPQLTEVTGTIRPLQQARIAAKVMGVIEDLPITLGQRVHTGDLLAKISAGEISARVAQAQSQLNSARRDLDRERELLTKGASTADMVRGLEDRFSGAQAMVREAETMLGYATIRAPFDGVIARKFANAGDLASPGFPLLELEGTADFQVEVAVPDSLTGRLAAGSTLAVEVPAVGATFSGVLAELSSAADSNAHTVLAKITVPPTAVVRSGEFARVQLPNAPVMSLLIPASAVSQVGQLERVFVVAENGRSELRLVKTGASRGDRVEILAGLDARERVVISPPAGLVEGQSLEIVP